MAGGAQVSSTTGSWTRMLGWRELCSIDFRSWFSLGLNLIIRRSLDHWLLGLWTRVLLREIAALAPNQGHHLVCHLMKSKNCGASGGLWGFQELMQSKLLLTCHRIKSRLIKQNFFSSASGPRFGCLIVSFYSSEGPFQAMVPVGRILHTQLTRCWTSSSE
jgi:hypothetical protein